MSQSHFANMMPSASIATGLFLFLLSSSTATAAAITTPDLSLLLQTSNTSLANFAPLDDDEHPHMTLAIEFGDINLPPTALLMNGVDALYQLVPLEYLGRQDSFHAHMVEYPQVVIDVEPVPPATDFENRAAILCIYGGMEEVVSRRTYKNVEVDCKRDGVLVAQVHFDLGGHHAAASAAASSQTHTLTVSEQPTKSNGTTLGLFAGNSTFNSTTPTDISPNTIDPIFYFRADC